MPAIHEVLNQGLQLHKQGALDQAERCYRQVLEADARHADAWHLLGLIAHARGDQTAAREQIGRAIALDGGQPSYHNHLAEVYRALGDTVQAEASCRRALQLNDRFVLAHNTLGVVYNQDRRFAEAAECFRRAVELQPGFPLAHANLGIALHGLGQLDEAADACRQALALDSALATTQLELARILLDRGEAAEAIETARRAASEHPQMAAVHYTLGGMLHAQQRLDEAVACYRRALDCNPALAEAHFNLGVLLQKRGDAEAAIACYRQAVRCRPDYAEAYSNLGTLHKSRGELDSARQCYDKALEFRPNFAEALNNLGNVLKIEGRLDEALICYEQCLRFAPQFAQARYNRGLMRLAEGELAAGWEDYEARCGCPEFPKRSFDRPRWTGEPLAGRTLLVHAEQGLGDTLQFVRYLPLLAERGDNVVLEVQPPLVPLLRTAGIDRSVQLVAKGEALPEFDVYLPLLSLPGVFGTTLETIPAAEGYLRADAKLAEHWRAALGERDAFKIGIAWQGSPTHASDRFRSIPLAAFAPLAFEGVELVSLQKGPGNEQVAALDGKFTVRELGASFDEEHGAFMDTAAVIKNLDLVVTSDTAIAHLAGALGAPVWLALTLVPDWRWMYCRTDSPWYRSMRLFRQKHLGDWPGVFADIAAMLRSTLETKRPQNH
ncbi:MAG: tetratricopeptide repeat protein [Planctomycetota bacterium]|nr:MAG: tetratricopeptide repeat protein [Planctomycetota bacterium]